MLKVENKFILIVEDDCLLRKQLEDHFGQCNELCVAENLAQATTYIKTNAFDIVLLDLILPDGNGLTLLDMLDGIPVVILSDLGEPDQILQGLEEGALDYIVKPAPLSIIEARMCLRLAPRSQSVLTIGDMTIDTSKRKATFRGTTLTLTSNEFNILAFLAQNAGVTFSTSEIYEQVWKMPSLNSQTVRIHLHNLRKKMMEVSEACGNLIITVFGKGYAFCV